LFRAKTEDDFNSWMSLLSSIIQEIDTTKELAISKDKAAFPILPPKESAGTKSVLLYNIEPQIDEIVKDKIMVSDSGSVGSTSSKVKLPNRLSNEERLASLQSSGSGSKILAKNWMKDQEVAKRASEIWANTAARDSKYAGKEDMLTNNLRR